MKSNYVAAVMETAIIIKKRLGTKSKENDQGHLPFNGKLEHLNDYS